MSNQDKTYEPEKLEREIQQFWNENEMFSVTEDPEKEKKSWMETMIRQGCSKKGQERQSPKEYRKV